MSDYDKLHEAHEEYHHPMSGKGPRVFSMADMLGGQIICDFCKRWQKSLAGLPSGWTREDGKDKCPKCQ